MRTIKFRGKDLSTGEWRYGDLVQYNEDGVKYTTIFTDELRGHTYAVDQDTVGQSTCLFDMNEKEIYEGDILACTTEPNKCVIEWNKRLVQFQATWDNMPMTAADIFYCIIRRGYTVIGNIHDNPNYLSSQMQKKLLND